jgi:antitoxin VapB
MGLNIKNPEVERLAHELAEITGHSLTEAVGRAVRDCLRREKRKRERTGLAQELLVIGRRCAAHVSPTRSADHGGLLYDDRGLPK